MVTQNENENEIHFGNFLLKNENEVRFRYKDRKRKRISFSLSFWLTIRTENSKNENENRFRFRFGGSHKDRPYGRFHNQNFFVLGYSPEVPPISRPNWWNFRRITKNKKVLVEKNDRKDR